MRKLLSATCILSLLLLPTLVQAQNLQPSTWGMLKSRYGQETLDRPGVWTQVADAILSSPYLSDPTIKRIWRMVGQDDGFVGAGVVTGKVFLVYVNENYHLEQAFYLEPDPPSGRVTLSNAVTGEIVWSEIASQDLIDRLEGVDKTHVRTMVGGTGPGVVRRFACAGLGWEITGVCAGLGAAAGGPGGAFIGGAIGAGAGKVFYDWCVNLHDPFPITFDGGPNQEPGETIGHNFGPKGPNQ